MKYRSAEIPMAIRSFFIRKGNEHGHSAAEMPKRSKSAPQILTVLLVRAASLKPFERRNLRLRPNGLDDSLQFLNPPVAILPVKVFTEIILQEHPEHGIHVVCQVQIWKITQRLPPDFALSRGMERSGKAVGPIKQNHIAIIVAVPVLHAHQPRCGDRQAGFLQDFPDHCIDKGFPFSTWPPGKVMPGHSGSFRF